MSDTANTKAPFLRVSPDNQGPAVVVTAYILVITTILTTLTRLIGGLAKKRTLNVADGLSIAATILALLQSISINLAATHGLGRHINSISTANIGSYYKASYASQLIAVAALTCAKISIIQLVRLLIPKQNTKTRLIITVLVGFWTVFAIFSLAFQCGLPHPWVYTAQKCNSGGLVYAIVGLSIVTDLYLSIFFIPTIWSLQMDVFARVTLACLFLSKLFVCIAGVVELVFLSWALSSLDQTWAQTGAVITGQVTMNLSIITTNLPALRRFLYDLQTGQSGARLGDHQGDLELSSESWTRSKKDASRSKSGSDRTKLASLQSQLSWKKEPDSHSEGGSEDGILRVVDVTVHREERVS